MIEPKANSKSSSRPEIAHILFIDIVGYSKLLITEQIDAVKQLNQIVRESATFCAAEQEGRLIRQSTGDGVVLIFFQSPEEPLQCAIEITDALQGLGNLRVRMGAHSGPVSKTEDINGQINAAGGGLNIARRVLDCGDAGHILLSKRLADDLAEYAEWRPYLTDLGECVVKHGLKLQVVSFRRDRTGNSSYPDKLAATAYLVGPATVAAKERPRRFRLVAVILLCGCLIGGGIVTYLKQQHRSAVLMKSVAVLPFESLSDEHKDAYFADGIQDEIIRDLTKIADLKVISRPSVVRYRDVTVSNLHRVADALGVRFVLEGSVQRSNDRIRVQAQLVDAHTNSHLWAEHYDRQLEDVFGIQSEIAQRIVEQLQARLTPEEKEAIKVFPTKDVAAYELYVRGKTTIDRVIYDSSRIEDLQEAEKLLNQATARDPQFFLAYCKLAYVHDQIYFNSLDHSDNRLRLAADALKVARQLQPEAGETHLASASHYYFGYLDYSRAREELSAATKKLPGDPYPILLSGYINRRLGHWEESTRELERILELDPQNLLFLRQVALSYANLRRYPDMIKVLDRAINLAPADPSFVVQRAMVELDWRADPKSLHLAIDRLLSENHANASVIADQWINLALCENDANAAKRAVEAMSENGCQEEGLPYPLSWCEGLVARQRNDMPAATRSFEKARLEVASIVEQQPYFAAGLSVLGMIDAALGSKKQAVEEGHKAVDLLPVSKDAITGAVLLRNMAVIYAWTDEKEAAINQLQRLAMIPSYLSYGELRLHPYWSPLRDDQGFKEIVATLERE